MNFSRIIKTFFILLLPVFLVAANDTIPLICIDTVKAEKIARDLLKKDNLEKQNENLRTQILNMETLVEYQHDLNTMFKVTIISQQNSIENLTSINNASVELMSGIKQDIEAFRLSYYNKNISLESENKDLKKSIKNKNTTIVILGASIAAMITGIIVL